MAKKLFGGKETRAEELKEAKALKSGKISEKQYVAVRSRKVMALALLVMLKPLSPVSCRLKPMPLKKLVKSQ